jgi:hypothetical protein
MCGEETFSDFGKIGERVFGGDAGGRFSMRVGALPPMQERAFILGNQNRPNAPDFSVVIVPGLMGVFSVLIVEITQAVVDSWHCSRSHWIERLIETEGCSR